MPFSSNSGKHLIDRAVQRIADANENLPIRVLDIGIGSGTYFNRYSQTLLPKPRTRWEGIEVWQPYVDKYALESKYNQVYVCDARTFEIDESPNRPQCYDICFVGDVAEHMTKEEAVALIEKLSGFCGTLIMSIPIVHYPQGPYEGNPYEEHIKDDWSHEEVMSTFRNLVEYGVENEIGVYFLSKVIPEKLAKWLAPKIAVYAICKNEGEFASRFALSVGQADEIVICDTGSTDSTVNDLRAILPPYAQIISTHVNPWRFDDARNTALMLVPQDVDLCVSLDLDEVLEHDWKSILDKEVRSHYRTRGKLFDKYNCRFQTIWDWRSLAPDQRSNNMSSHWHERIHTRHNWKWRLPVHEVLTYTGTEHAEEIAWLGGFMMTQKPDMAEGKHTYLPLLEQSLKEDPKVWKSWFFYADELFKVGRFQDGVSAITSALDVPGADKAYLYSILGERYERLAGDPYKARENYQAACRAAPLSRERWVNLAKFHISRGERLEALSVLEQAKKCQVPSSGYDFDPSCWGPAFDAFVNKVQVVQPVR